MAKSKSSKPKIDYKQLLLSKGEYIALGVAGLFTLILLINAVSMATSAKDPHDIAKDLKKSADLVQTKIKSADVSAEDEKLTAMPEWLKHPNKYPTVPVQEFALNGIQFDPIAKPDTKREKPVVLPVLGQCQVNLIKFPFKAYDIYEDKETGQIEIGVIVDKQVSKMDQDARKKFVDKMRGKSRPSAPSPTPPPAPGGPGGFGPPGLGGPGLGGPGSMGGRPGMGMGNRFEQNAKRVEHAVEYIPIDQLDASMEKGHSPAMTVVPLRGVVVHMEVPYKAQLEEIKRALRLPTLADAMSATESSGTPIYQDGNIYVGYEVQRRVLAVNEEGKLVPEVDWPKEDKDGKEQVYPYLDYYVKYIFSRKIADVVEDPYLANFIRPKMNLVLPLPQLVSELGKYPPLALENIGRAIRKLQDAGVTPAQASDTVKRLTGGGGDVFSTQSSGDAGASQLFGQNQLSGAGMRPQLPTMPGPGGPGLPGRPGGPGGPAGAAATDTGPDAEHLLLRFVDVNIEKGKTYQYRIRLVMHNPNYNRKEDVSNEVYALKPTLTSPWTELGADITIPPEDLLYALDVGTFRKTIAEENKGTGLKDTSMREYFDAREGQAVVEMCRWMMEVRPDAGNKQREPVGAWVVADLPVGRGEYIGRKQFVKLPLWASANKAYELREIADKEKKGRKDLTLPKGWLIDFTSADILVDLTGGRVNTKLRPNDKNIVEDVASELLIVSPDGKLSVKKSATDEDDPTRREIVNGWTSWINKVKEAKEDAGK